MKSYVYFIGEEGTDFVKIGKANLIRDRKRQLDTANPRVLIEKARVKVYSERDALAMEKLIHHGLKSKRVAKGNEWFKLTDPEIKKAAHKYQKVYDTEHPEPVRVQSAPTPKPAIARARAVTKTTVAHDWKEAEVASKKLTIREVDSDEDRLTSDSDDSDETYTRAVDEFKKLRLGEMVDADIHADSEESDGESTPVPSDDDFAPDDDSPDDDAPDDDFAPETDSSSEFVESDSDS